MKRRATPIGVSLAVLLGLLVGRRFQLTFWICFPSAVIGFIAAGFFYLKSRKFLLDQAVCRWSRFFLYAGLFLLGCCRSLLGEGAVSQGNIRHSVGTSVRFEGRIVEPLHGAGARYRAVAEVVPADGLPDEGRVELVFFEQPDLVLTYGTLVHAEGYLRPLVTGQGGGVSVTRREQLDGVMNSPRVRLISAAHGFSWKGWMFRLREKGVARVMELFPDYENSLMAGILLGNEDYIPTSIQQAFKQTGTSHIIAISGANFSVICWVMMLLLSRAVPHWSAPLCTVPLIFFYANLVGGSPAVMRAAWMSSFSMLGYCFGRHDHGLNSLALTTAIMALIHPYYMEDVGFQLSVAATLGILLFLRPFTRLTEKGLLRIPWLSPRQRIILRDILSDWVLVSVSAQLFTTWVSAAAFGKVPFVGIPANFVIAPFQSFLMVGGMASLLLSVIFMPLGKVLAWLVWPAPAVTIRVVEAFADSSAEPYFMALSQRDAWLLIGCVSLLWVSRDKWLKGIRRKWVYGVLLLEGSAALFVWGAVAERSDKRLRVDISADVDGSVLILRALDHQRILLASGVSYEDVRDWFGRSMFFDDPITVAGIDFDGTWSRDQFFRSGIAADAELLFLDGYLRKGPPELGYLREGSRFSGNGFELEQVGGYLGRRAWLLRTGEREVLFPLGTSPSRLFVPGKTTLNNVDLICLSRADDGDAWRDFRPMGGTVPVADGTGYSSVTLRTDGEDVWLVGFNE